MLNTSDFIFLFFFFQAEDGIRDWSVNGVQTCALPISGTRWLLAATTLVGVLVLLQPAWFRGLLRLVPGGRARRFAASVIDSATAYSNRRGHLRSEERRVGKECRARWARYHEKKKTE